MARKTKEEAEKTQQALLEAAAELFTSQGVSTTTLNEIAKKAGVTRGAFYWHFEDKSDVIKALWETTALPKLMPLREALRSIKVANAAGELREIIGRMVDLFITDEQVGQAMFIVMHKMEISDKDYRLVEYLYGEHMKFQSALVEAFEVVQRAGGLRQGILADYAARGFVCMFMGVINKHLLPFTDLDLERDGMTFLNLYLDGVLADR